MRRKVTRMDALMKWRQERSRIVMIVAKTKRSLNEEEDAREEGGGRSGEDS